MAIEKATGPQRWARDYVFDILSELEIHHIFGVPGTNEIPIIDGTCYPENKVEYIECLHENIAIGAAMGSARMTGKPGVLVVHVTPGIAHSIGNLFNAARSQVPLVILCCQQQNELVTQEPLLASNLVDLAKQYTKWAHEVRTPEEFPMVLQRAFKEAMAPPNGPVFVSIPWEFTMRSIGDLDRVPGVTRISPHFTGDPQTIQQVATLLSQAQNPIIIGGDAVGYADAWPEMQQLAELVGAPVLLQTFSSVANFPNNDYHWQGELPGSQQAVQQVFEGHDVAFLCGFSNQAQITVFKYSQGALIPPHVRQIYLTNNTWDIGKNYYGEAAILGDIKATLPLINDKIRQHPPAGADQRNQHLRQLDATRRVAWDQYLSQAMRQDEIWAVVIADALRKEIEQRGLAKKFVYVHEAVSDPAPFQYLLPLGTEGSAPISYYCVGGGSLGWSMPATLGIKLEQRGWQQIETSLVVAATGDGSSLFYPQTWWTAAHREIGVLYIITNNHEYHTLQLGLQQVIEAYGSAPGYGWKPKTDDPEYLRIHRPEPDFVALAKSLGGLEGEVVNHPEAVRAAVQRGISHVTQTKQSYLLDMRTAQATPVPPSREEATRKAMARYVGQPRLDVFHHPAGKGLLGADGSGTAANVPVIF
ncbi:thiamine pyrophosphate-binding protein [Chitinimonas sp. BJB300]|uniref:thiamine pyrophosphate-binding protein n=1 Tax=Chitinimonas sp. BJB300 TaxID=1559339 RepID=UPI000C109895|nr:thiamine pyrophosphate-binding protein [Chitinimonas sp. BJB300]PHV11691.1 benzoylformate decarboxylase [Chitinimonas sp. BJB300]TSJ88590.1 thiamine pyrophosphate-binding protein [Chitinimonas sp. BJB300]